MTEPAPPRRSRALRIAIIVAVVAFVLPSAAAVVARILFIEAFSIPAGSMGPTLWPGDHIFVSKSFYGLLGHVPQIGDVVVFRYPHDRSKDFVKRIVGVAGDVIELRDGVLHRNGEEVPRCFVGEHAYGAENGPTGGSEARRARLYLERLGGVVHLTLNDLERYGDDGGTWRVAAGQVFVLGDNRDNSHDSRYWGGVPLGDLKGRATSIWWSSKPGRAGTDLHGPPILPSPLNQPLRRCLAELRPRISR